MRSRSTPGKAGAMFLLLACTEPAHSGKPDGDSGVDTSLPVDTGDTTETGDTDSSPDPLVCDPTSPWVQVSAGFQLTCGVHADGCGECWGRGDGSGVPDTGGAYNYYGEDRVPGYRWAKIRTSSDGSYGPNHACGVTTEGDGWCWGRNDHLQCDVPPGVYQDIVPLADSTIGILAEGRLAAWGIYHTYAEAGVYVQLEGGGYYGGAIDAAGALVTFHTAGGDTEYWEGIWSDLGMGAGACGIRSDLGGALECWYPTTGDGPSDDFPLANPPEGSFQDVCVTGSVGACAVDTAGELACFGADGDPITAGVPTGPFVAVTCGTLHACALTPDGHVECWGEDHFGETIPPS